MKPSTLFPKGLLVKMNWNAKRLERERALKIDQEMEAERGNWSLVSNW